MRFRQNQDGLYVTDDAGRPLCGCSSCLQRCLDRYQSVMRSHEDVTDFYAEICDAHGWTRSKSPPPDSADMIMEEYWARIANALIGGSRHE